MEENYKKIEQAIKKGGKGEAITRVVIQRPLEHKLPLEHKWNLMKKKQENKEEEECTRVVSLTTRVIHLKCSRGNSKERKEHSSGILK